MKYILKGMNFSDFRITLVDFILKSKIFSPYHVTGKLNAF